VAQGFVVQLPQRLFKTVNGALVPASGWVITTFEVGTTTPKETWSDGQLTSSNGTSVTTDADGFYRMLIAQGDAVKCVVKDDGGVSQYTFDYQQPMIADPNAGSVTAVPAGSVVWSPYSTLPTGYLLCDGSAVSRSTYAALAALAAADAYPNGSGDGSTTFNLPDLRGRAPYGVAASGTGSTLGATFGSLDHTHTGPSHTHVTTVPRDGWGLTLNTPSVSERLNVGYASGTGQFSSSYQPTGDVDVTSAAGGTGNTGTGNAPGVTGYWFIKT